MVVEAVVTLPYKIPYYLPRECLSLFYLFLQTPSKSENTLGDNSTATHLCPSMLLIILITSSLWGLLYTIIHLGTKVHPPIFTPHILYIDPILILLTPTIERHVNKLVRLPGLKERV